MERALVINDATTSNMYAIATEKDGSIRIFGADEAAQEWAEWTDARLQGRGKLEDIVKFLDNTFKIDGPKPLTRPIRVQIAQSMTKFGQRAQNEIAVGRTEQPEQKSVYSISSALPVVANPGMAINRATSTQAKMALINYKGMAFRQEQAFATMGYDIKKARAVFDPNLAGGNGGWRCPVGTRYGGQITDRFGRGCGWGVARRIANALTDTGERLERGLDARRQRRVARRNERIARRLTPNAPNVPGRRRSGLARGMARGGEIVTPSGKPRRNRRGVPEQMDQLADRVDGGWGRRPRAERRAGRVGERRTRPGGQVGRTGLPERMERAANEVLEGTFLENRRRRRRERQGRARNREGLPERMERTANEVLEGTFLENRRRRRAARSQQAQDRPRVAATERPRRVERTPQRPRRRTRVAEDDQDLQPPRLDDDTETPRPKPPKRDERYRRVVPNGDSPRHSDISDGAEQSRRINQFIARLREKRNANNKVIEQHRRDGRSLNNRIREYQGAARDHDRVARDGNRSIDDRMDAAENRDIALQLVRDMKNPEQAPQPPRPPQSSKPPAPPAPTSTPRRSPRPNNPSTEPRRRINENAVARVTPGRAVTLNDIFEQEERNRIESEIEESVVRAQEEAKANIEKFADDQEKLRELTSAAQRRLAGAERVNLGSDQRGRGAVSIQDRVDALYDMATGKAQSDIYRSALQRAYERNGENRPSPERLAEMGEAARKEFKDTLSRRAKNLGSFMTRKYGDGPAPWLADDRMTRDKLRTASPDEIQEWAKKVYEHDEIVTPSGAVFRTRVNTSGSSFGRGNADVYGDIDVKDPKTGDWIRVGHFHRRINADRDDIYHASMSLDPSRAPEHIRPSIRNSGFTNTFNGHAITWLKGAGFKGSGISAVDDGPFVWPRLGFRTTDQSRIDRLHDAMRNELSKFRAGGRSIIANDRDAAKIEFLLNQTRRRTPADVQHQDFILALSNRDDDDQVVRNFFRDGSMGDWGELYGFANGVLTYNDDNFPDDPRRVA